MVGVRHSTPCCALATTLQSSCEPLRVPSPSGGQQPSLWWQPAPGEACRAAAAQGSTPPFTRAAVKAARRSSGFTGAGPLVGTARYPLRVARPGFPAGGRSVWPVEGQYGRRSLQISASGGSARVTHYVFGDVVGARLAQSSQGFVQKAAWCSTGAHNQDFGPI